MLTQSGNPQLDIAPPSSRGRNTLYTVSISKFMMLYVFTLGGYAAYWPYRNWSAYRNATGVDVMPVMRGLFWPLFVFSLFEKVQNRLDRAGRSYRWNPKPRAWLIILVVTISLMLPWFVSPRVNALVVLTGSVALVVGGMYLFVGAQRAINMLDKYQQGNCSKNLAV